MEPFDTDIVTISRREYESLLDDARWRECVEDAGVDNWSGYEYAMAEYYAEDDN
jgi:hypothetical protein